jgi:hypothetical protein
LTVKDGVPFVDRLYKASDCVVIAHRTTFFKSPSRARQELEKELKKAEMVIERARVVNNGEQIGERVLMRVNAAEQNKTATEVIWNNNSELHSCIPLHLSPRNMYCSSKKRGKLQVKRFLTGSIVVAM